MVSCCTDYRVKSEESRQEFQVLMLNFLSKKLSTAEYASYLNNQIITNNCHRMSCCHKTLKAFIDSLKRNQRPPTYLVCFLFLTSKVLTALPLHSFIANSTTRGEEPQALQLCFADRLRWLHNPPFCLDIFKRLQKHTPEVVFRKRMNHCLNLKVSAGLAENI